MKFDLHFRRIILVLATVSLGLASSSKEIVAGELYGTIRILVENGDGAESAAPDDSGAVVYVTGFEEPSATDRRTITLDQANQTFLPRVLAVRAGDTVTFRNHDIVVHNIWSLSPAKTFDLGQFRSPEERSVTFERPGLVTLFCNIHPQMMGSIVVLKNRRFSVTGPDGQYRITGIPKGHLDLRVWTEGVEPTVRSIDVTERSSQRIDFTVRERFRPAHHPNKDGKPYERYD